MVTSVQRKTKREIEIENCIITHRTGLGEHAEKVQKGNLRQDVSKESSGRTWVMYLH